jgi:AraC-like DNA-binding protein/tetratricopeptide (TPR) repeat protein
MKLPPRVEPRPAALRPPVPRDVRSAVERMRRSVSDPISMRDLARHCGVAERTLNKHFRAFLGLSPMRYLQQLRLAAARETLLAGQVGLSVTEVAKRYCFNHFGRFAAQYRRAFGEAPSVTLANTRAALRASATREDADAPQFLPPQSRDKPSVGILPCDTPPGELDLAWTSESIAEALAAALTSVGALDVKTPRSLRAAAHDPRRQARETNARYLLTGRIVPAGTRLRVILRLIEPTTGRHVWGDSFDGEPNQPHELQDRIIAALFDAIPQRVRGAEIERARRAAPQNLDAYGLTMRALPFVFASRPDAARRALEFLHRAIEIDPDYGLATALAAWAHGQLVMYNGTTTAADEHSQALTLAHRAAILDDDDPLVLAARCAVHTMADEFDIAEALVTRSLARDPSCGWAWGRSAWLQAYKGDSATAIEQFGRAITLDPNPASRTNTFTGIGAAHFNAGRYEAAAVWLENAMIAEPTTAWPNRSLSVTYARLGERLKAKESLEALRNFCPDLTVGRVVAAVPFRPDFLDRLGDGLDDLGLPP